jgi:phosphocarrier protein
MLESRVHLPEGVALHARPAGRLVREAARFQAKVTVAANGKTANARSILEVLALGATGGAELTFRADGSDAAEALSALTALVDSLTE